MMRRPQGQDDSFGLGQVLALVMLVLLTACSGGHIRTGHSVHMVEARQKGL